MKVQLIYGLFFITLASCGSHKEGGQALVYQEEYQRSIQHYQDTVNPQLYYHTDRKQIIVSKKTIESIKKSDVE